MNIGDMVPIIINGTETTARILDIEKNENGDIVGFTVSNQ